MLSELSEEDGYCRLIDALHGWGVYDSQRSWFESDGGSDEFGLFRYEDLAADEAAFINRLLSFLNVDLSASTLESLIERHRFARYSDGRAKGKEDRSSHYRIGRAGQWQERLSDRVVRHFRDKTGDLVELMGYGL